MKTTLTTALLLLLMIIGIKAQINIKETIVSPPQLKSQKQHVEKDESLCNHLKNNIIYPESAAAALQEGIVKVAFNVQRNGQLNNFRVIQSVCYECDQQVIEALKLTSKCWSPGRINHEPVDMETTVAVLFDLTDTRTDKELAIALYNTGIRRYYMAHNPLITPRQQQRKLEASIKSLNQALKYTPNEHCITAVKSMVYNSMGDMTKKLETIQQLVTSLDSTDPKEAALLTIYANKR